MPAAKKKRISGENVDASSDDDESFQFFLLMEKFQINFETLSEESRNHQQQCGAHRGDDEENFKLRLRNPCCPREGFSSVWLACFRAKKKFNATAKA